MASRLLNRIIMAGAVALVGCSSPVDINQLMSQYSIQCNEPGSALGTGMYTKLVGQPFNVEVDLIKSGTLSSMPSDVLGMMTASLDFTEAASQAGCEGGTGVVSDLAAPLNVPLNLNGRMVVNGVQLNNAHRQLWCRANIFYSGSTYRKCTPAAMTLRPANFVMDVVYPGGTPKLAANGDLIKAAGVHGSWDTDLAKFTLRARAVSLNNMTTALTGFTGGVAAWMDSTKVTARSRPANDALGVDLPIEGTLTSGYFDFVNGEATAQFTYSEVGYLNLDSAALVINGFTATDQAAGKCRANDASNTPDGSGKIGCNIASTLAKLPIKFVPYQLKIDSPVTKTVADAANSCSRFAYYGGEVTTNFSLKAVTTNGSVTRNYSDSIGLALFNAADYSKYQVPAVTVKDNNNQNTTISFQKADASNAITASGWVNGVNQISLRHKISRPATPIAPVSMVINANPTDGEVTTSSSTQSAMSGIVQYRYGQIKLANAYGAETMPLNYEVNAQYFKNGTWVNNKEDSCSQLSANMFKFETAAASAKNNIVQCGSLMSTLNNGTFSQGKATMRLSAPGNGNNGWFYLTLKRDGVNDGSESCVQGSGKIATQVANAVPQFGNTNPASERAMVSFGQYKSKYIYSGEQ